MEEIKNEKNPVVDALNALTETLDITGIAEDSTALFGAILSMPEDEFTVIAPVILDEINRSLNNPNDRLTLTAAMQASGYKGDDLVEIFNELCEEIDKQLLEVSQQKRDWIKQVIGLVTNAINETEGISKRYIHIPYEKCHEDAKMPAYAHASDSGMDVYALKDITIAPGETCIVPIGIKVALPAGYELQVRPKSGLSAKSKLRVANTPGTIDAGYRDEIGVIIENTEAPIRDITYKEEFGEDGTIKNLNITSILYGPSYTIEKGQKFAQLVLCEVPKAVLYEVENVSEIGEDRGGGFGSTGLK